MIQNPSERKTAEALSTECRTSAPGCLLRRGDSKRAEFSAEWMVNKEKHAVQKFSRAVQYGLSCRELQSRTWTGLKGAGQFGGRKLVLLVAIGLGAALGAGCLALFLIG
jgi:hypothetical protein